jgi:predicted glycoside hydrolase/deacetylase ChbG (UPF0249 family)
MAAVTSWGASSATAETWAERLGFPPESKVLVLHAHGLGMCHETNAAGEQLMESGHVRSASAMPPCPWFADVAQWSTKHRDADLGLQLTINSEWQRYRWKPVLSDGSVASLTDTDRFLWHTPIQTMVNASADEVERELRAQIEWARANGLQPTHLTTHLGTLFTRLDLTEVYLRVARQYWIPAVVVDLTPEQVERFRSKGYPVPDALVQVLDSYPLPKVDDLRIVGSADSYEAKKQSFLKMIRELPPGITQIAFQPAVESEALKLIAGDWQQRVWEAQLMKDDEVRAVLKSDGVIITDWRELMDRFEGRRSRGEER